MDLGVRLEKLGARDEVLDAFRAFVASREGSLAEAERALAAEFEAIVETMVLLAAIDGFVTDDELGQLRSSIEAMVGEPAGGLEELLASSLEKLTRDGWQSRVKDVADRLRSPASRSLAFRLGAAVAFVDDDVAQAEAEAIEALAAAFGMSAEQSQTVLREVVDDLFGG